jgi:hypothetical protein
VICAWARDMKKMKAARTIAGSLRLTPSCLRRHFQSPNLKQAEPENHSVHLHGNENCICCTTLCDWSVAKCRALLPPNVGKAHIRAL